MPLAVAADSQLDPVQIAISGMLIVLVALTLISLFITALPWILSQVAKVWPEPDTSHKHEGQGHPESLRPDDDAVLAAIGFVLHTEFQRQLEAGQSKSQ